MVQKPKEVLGFEEQVSVSLSDISPKELKMKSDVDDDEIPNLCVLYVLGEVLGIDVLKNFADNFLKLRVSRFRLGRREIVGIGSGIFEPERKKLRTIKELFMGMR